MGFTTPIRIEESALEEEYASEAIHQTLGALRPAAHAAPRVRVRFLWGLVNDASALLGVRRRQLAFEMLASPSGRAYAARALRVQARASARAPATSAAFGADGEKPFGSGRSSRGLQASANMGCEWLQQREQ